MQNTKYQLTQLILRLHTSIENSALNRANFFFFFLVEWQYIFVILIFLLYSRYASLYFVAAIENSDNELITLEIIHRYVELLDKYFGSVSYLSHCF